MSIYLPNTEFSSIEVNNVLNNLLLKTQKIHETSCKYPSPFNEEWWLEASTNGRYDIIEVRHDGILQLSMPIFQVKRFGFTLICMPAYTRTLGANLYIPPSKPFKRSQNIRNLVDEFVGKLPKHDSIRIRLDPDDETVFGFSLLNFICEEQFTFRVPYHSDIHEIWKNCDQKTRNVIRSAERKLSVDSGIEFSEFKRISLLNTLNKKNTNDFNTMERIFNAAQERGQATILSARNEAGKNIAAVIIVWGSKYAYFWQSARDLSCGIGGANALLLWKAIEMTKGMGLSFDFDSYGSVKSAKFLSSFGLIPIIRTEISRQTVPYKLFKLANGVVQQRTRVAAEPD